MVHFFKRLFTGKEENPEEKQAQDKAKNFDILKYDGIRAQRIGKLPYAVKCLEEALAIKEDAETRHHLVNAYVQMNRIEEACQLMQNALEKEPENIDLYFMLANLHFMQEEYTAMQEVLQRGAKVDDKHPQLHYLLAKAYDGQHNALQTIAELTLAIALKEDFYDAYLMRANTLLRMGQTENAEEDANKLYELMPEEEQTLLTLGEVYAVKGESERAIDYFQQVSSMNPFNEKAYLNIAMLLGTEKKWEEAVKALDEGIEINPNAAELYHHRGRYKLQVGDKEGSAEDLKKALELNPEKEQQITGEFRNYENPFKVDIFSL